MKGSAFLSERIPEYLVIGHVTKDLLSDGAILGGTCSYAALTAHKLGQRTAAITSSGPDIPQLQILDGIRMINIPSKHSTTFENLYFADGRVQKWYASSQKLSLDDVPANWRGAPIVHLAPIGQEISPSLCGQFPGSLICVTVQGWLRGTDELDTVIFEPHPQLKDWLPKIDILVMSLADVFGDEAALSEILGSVKLGVETLGPEGCKIYHEDRVIHIPVKPQPEIDPTGAGDIFAAAFFIRYRETRDFIQAGLFANACASLSVMKIGLEGIPELSEVETHKAAIYASY